MKLVWLHGAPAAGKLTLAKQLQNDHGFKLFHNHLAVDICLSIYPEFGSGDFHDFADLIRRMVLTKAKSLGVERMVMTYMVCGEQDHEAVKQYLAYFSEQGLDVFPVYLAPSTDVLLQRVQSEERKKSNKISCPYQLAELLSAPCFKPVQHEKLLIIDTSYLSPTAASERIMEHLKSYGP